MFRLGPLSDLVKGLGFGVEFVMASLAAREGGNSIGAGGCGFRGGSGGCNDDRPRKGE